MNLDELARKLAFSSDEELLRCAIDPFFRRKINARIDLRAEPRRLAQDTVYDEIVIGGGLHAATYVASAPARDRGDRVILDQGKEIGGIFALAQRPVFYLNSRNRPERAIREPGTPGPLNSIVGGIVQPSQLGWLEYQPQNEFALAIRLNIAAFSRFVTGVTVQSVTRDGDYYQVRYTYPIQDRTYIVSCRRVVAATGLGEPRIPFKLKRPSSGLSRVQTFPEFCHLMGVISRPLQGYKKVAIIGARDSGNVVAEFLLGLGPQPEQSTAAQDFVESITWIGQSSRTDKDFIECNRTRYVGLSRSFPRDGKPNYYYRIQPEAGRAVTVVEASKSVRVDWMGPQGAKSDRFDHVIVCTGFENKVADLFQAFDPDDSVLVKSQTGIDVARQYPGEKGEQLFVVGPAAELPVLPEESGLVEIPENTASAFRYGERTALFAKEFPLLYRMVRVDVARDIPSGPRFTIKARPKKSTSIAEKMQELRDVVKPEF